MQSIQGVKVAMSESDQTLGVRCPSCRTYNTISPRPGFKGSFKCIRCKQALPVKVKEEVSSGSPILVTRLERTK